MTSTAMGQRVDIGKLRVALRRMSRRNLLSVAYRAIELVPAGQLERRKKPATVRGLNKDHNHELKDIFKGAATRVSGSRGPLRDFYENLLAKGRKPTLARLTLTRKIAAITLIVSKKEVRFDANYLNHKQLERLWLRTFSIRGNHFPAVTVGLLRRSNSRGSSNRKSQARAEARESPNEPYALSDKNVELHILVQM